VVYFTKLTDIGAAKIAADQASGNSESPHPWGLFCCQTRLRERMTWQRPAWLPSVREATMGL